MEPDSNLGRIDGAHHTLKQDSDFAKTIFESYLKLVHRWIPQLISHEALESIDADLLASTIVEVLIFELAKRPNKAEMLREETMRFCRQIAKSLSVNAVNHIHCQKRKNHRDEIDLASLFSSRARNGTSEQESVVDSNDFVHAIQSALPERHQHIVEQVMSDFTKTEIATELGVSLKVLQRMLNEIGVVIYHLENDRNGAHSPITHHPSPITQHPTPNQPTNCQLPAKRKKKTEE